MSVSEDYHRDFENIVIEMAGEVVAMAGVR